MPGLLGTPAWLVASERAEPRSLLAPWALAAVVLAGEAMASLDAAIVNVAGPAIQAVGDLLGVSWPPRRLEDCSAECCRERRP